MAADNVIDSVTEDFAEVVAEITDHQDVALILDFISAPYFECNDNALNIGGRLVQLGIMGELKMPKSHLTVCCIGICRSSGR